MQGQRYFVERALEDAKQQGGFGEYQVRGWRGWHHHAALVMMAMLFITRERLEIDQPVLTAPDVQMMLVHYLPRRDRTDQDLFDLLRTRFRRRRQAFPQESPSNVTEQNWFANPCGLKFFVNSRRFGSGTAAKPPDMDRLAVR
jgi:hypothetical protein